MTQDVFHKAHVRNVALQEVRTELYRQDAKWGEQNHPNGTPGMWRSTTLDPLSRRVACDLAADKGTVTWAHILTEEVAEALAEEDPSLLRKELIQVAAVAVAWVEKIDRDEARNAS
jgi:hypothetical protein